MAMVPIPVEGRLTEYLHNKAAMKGVPLSGSFELTPCCNMACKMCYVRMTKAEQEAHAPLRTAEEWIDLGCAACEARDSCKACAAMVYTESGGFGTIPQYRCAMTKAYPEACKRVMEEIVAPIKPDPMKQIQEATK